MAWASMLVRSGGAEPSIESMANTGRSRQPTHTGLLQNTLCGGSVDIQNYTVDMYDVYQHTCNNI